jgi:hypothetical protein
VLRRFCPMRSRKSSPSSVRPYRFTGGVVLANVLPTTRTVFVEHYEDGARRTSDDPATFDLITFSEDDPEPVPRDGVWRVELGEPSWKALTREMVEAIIGAGYEKAAGLGVV